MLLLSNSVLYIFLGGLISLFLVIVAAFYLTQMNKNVFHHEGYILGSWKRKGMSPEGLLWTFEFHFDIEDFQMKGDPDFAATGKYRIIKEIENLLVLELYSVTGDLEHNSLLLEIAVNKKENKLTIDNRSGYERLKYYDKT